MTQLTLPPQLLLPALAVMAMLLLAGAAVALLGGGAARRLEQRIDLFVGNPTAAVGAGVAGASLTGAGVAGGGSLLHAVRRLGEATRRRTRLYTPQDLEALSAVLQAGGLNPRQALPLLIGAKMLLLVLLPVFALAYGWAAHMTSMHRILLAGGAVPAGLLGPDWVLGFVRRRYSNQIRLGIADALDLLVVCSEAGMGLESALEQVAREMAHSNRPMSVALATFLDELRVLPDRRDAYANFGNRLGLPELRRTATMLAQSQRYGAPLAQALRAVAAELRRDRMIRMEEKAVRLPAMLVFPLIFFIMPTLFIVLIGPAMLRLQGMFAAFAK